MSTPSEHSEAQSNSQPVAFSVLFIFFPSGLVLYWLVNNILQIAQQWHVNRMLENEAALVAAKRR